MKKITLLFAVIFSLSLSSFTQNWVEFTTSESVTPVCTVLTSNDTLVKFDVIIPGIFETPIDTFNRVNIKEHSKMDSVGYPEMPIVSFLVAIPECDGVNLNITLLDSTQFTGYNIYPAPELVPDTIAGGGVALVEEFAYNRAAYESDALFPGTVAEAIDKGAIRAQHVVRVVLYPVQFNPVKDIIKAYSDFQITLSFNNPIGSINKDVGIFNEVVGNTLINYQSNGLNASVSCGAGLDNAGSWKWATSFPNDAIMDTCDYLLITDEYFFNEQAAKVYIDSLARHRAEFNGFDVVMVKMIDIEDSINGINNKERIRNLIKNTYDNGYANNTYDGKLAYVNLFGDVDLWNGQECIPTHYEDPDHGGYDVYFTQVYPDEDDIYPDLMIGRCSVDTVTQVQNVVHKILNFKPEDLDYKDSLLFIVGGNSYSGYDDIKNALIETEAILGDTYHKKIMYHDDYANSNYFFLPQWETILFGLNSLQQSWQAGKMFVTYMDHGGHSKWISPSFEYDNIDSSIYDNTLPFVLSAACYTGGFQEVDDCMAERFLCERPERGAIGFVGATIATVWETMELSADYFHSLFNNFSSVTGEALVEIKLKNIFEPGFVDHYNLYGDPALNILYENLDSILPDLIIKEYDVSILPQLANAGDTVSISADIRNITTKNISSTFYNSCILIDVINEDTLWLGNSQVYGLQGYDEETIEFTWFTEQGDQGIYEIVFSIDTSNCVSEMNEKNTVSVSKTIYSFKPNFPVVNSASINSHPVSFNLYPTSEGEEIIFGENVISPSGEILETNPGVTRSLTCITNLSNDNEYQILQFNDEYNTVVSYGNPSWSYNLTSNFNIQGPFVTDIDNDGFEEVFVIGSANEFPGYTYYSKIVCINHNGSERWICDAPEKSFKLPVITQLGESKIILLIDINTKIYYYHEVNNELIISDSAQIPNCITIYNEPVASDIDKDGNLELVLLCDLFQNNQNIRAVVLFDIVTQLFSIKILDEEVDFDKMAISDITNNGSIDIIVSSANNGFLILNQNLDSLNFIPETTLNNQEIIFGDFNNNGLNDIVCQTKNLNQNYLSIFEQSGNEFFTCPIMSNMNYLWLSDIDFDGLNDIIYSTNKELFVLNVPNAGTSIGWPGQQGNIRNTGVLEHPAYFASLGDTVYWMNTISLAGDNELPEGSTVIIKPGTRVVAHDSASLIVNGKLIAIGSENHPIVFRSDINNSEAGYWQGITVKNHSEATFKYCEISGAEIGIYVEDKNETDIRKCTFQNNLTGIGASNSSPFVKKNIIINNNIGIGSYNNASPVLSDLVYEQPFKNGIINNTTGIQIDGASVYLDYGYNDIYNYPASGYYINILGGPGPYQLNAGFNYWGTTNVPEITSHLYPSVNININPICTSPQTSYTPPDCGESQMMQSGNNDMASGDYAAAENTFKSIVQQYPTTPEAYLSVSLIYECTGKSSGNWINLETYYTQLRQDTTITEEFDKLVFGYLNLCKRELGKFDEAIASYELIILNNPTYNDSVYAVIDIGNTYAEAGNYKTTMGQLSYLVPVSRAKHTEKTIDLLLSLKTEINNEETRESQDFGINKIYPNPFTGATTVEYYIPNDCKTIFSVFDASGKLINKLSTHIQEKGEYSITIDMGAFAPGVYHLLMVSGGDNRCMKKLILK
ncbi:MAG: T9SS type A sorting domain-containing protein [Bacteroidales bacterium]|nr:T9SS type A sorting domain-containing protein [Bacteroidales bacterium]